MKLEPTPEPSVWCRKSIPLFDVTLSWWEMVVENEGQSVTSALFCSTAHPNSVLVHESTFVLTEKILDTTFAE